MVIFTVSPQQLWKGGGGVVIEVTALGGKAVLQSVCSGFDGSVTLP